MIYCFEDVKARHGTKFSDDVLPRRRKGMSYKVSYSELNTTMPVEFTEQQVKSMNKREMARHNFKAYLLDSLYALKNGTTASFETVFTKSTVNHERFRSDLTIKMPMVKMYREKAYGHNKKSAESIASWYVLRQLPDFFVKNRENFESSQGKRKQLHRRCARSEVRPSERAKESSSNVVIDTQNESHQNLWTESIKSRKVFQSD